MSLINQKGNRFKNNLLWLNKLCIGLVYCLFVISLLLLDTAYAQDDLNPQQILKKMHEVYSKLSTYQDSGIVKTIMTSGILEGEERTLSFSTSFKRPNFMKFEWTDVCGLQKDRHVLWSNGKETYTYWQHANQYEKESSLEMGIAGATGISSGSAYNIPSMLIGSLGFTSSFKYTMLDDLFLLPQEVFEGKKCYVITGKHLLGVEYKLWIGVDDYFLRKEKSSIKSIKDTLSEVKSKLKEIGDEEHIQYLEKGEDISVIQQEIHRDIKVNVPISDDVFNFVPPLGTKFIENTKSDLKE